MTKDKKGKYTVKVDDNTGLSCSDCKGKDCLSCGRSSQYVPDPVTKGKIGTLKIKCPKCKEYMAVRTLKKHDCSKPTIEDPTAAIAKLQDDKLKLEEENLKLKEDNSERLESIKAQLSSAMKLCSD